MQIKNKGKAVAHCGCFPAHTLSLKTELELAFYELSLDVVLYICVEMPVDMGAVTDISGVVGKHLVNGFRVTLMRL